MKIAISGVTGFIGQYLAEKLENKGHKIIPLGRAIFSNATQLAYSLLDCDVIINLAGKPINCRWTKDNKHEIYTSRIEVTRTIVNAINSLPRKPTLFISTSAVGYYPYKGSFDEYNSTLGTGFLAQLCADWEEESRKVSPEVRLVNTRLAVVIDPKAGGGAMKKMAKSAKMGIATIIGSGQQAFPWIALDDYVRAVEFVITNNSFSGIVNLASPQPTNNKTFTRALAKHYNSFITIKIPKCIVSLLMGKASSFFTKGQSVKPTKLLEAGFTFESDTVDKLLSI